MAGAVCADRTSSLGFGVLSRTDRSVGSLRWPNRLNRMPTFLAPYWVRLSCSNWLICSEALSGYLSAFSVLLGAGVCRISSCLRTPDQAARNPDSDYSISSCEHWWSCKQPWIWYCQIDHIWYSSCFEIYSWKPGLLCRLRGWSSWESLHSCTIESRECMKCSDSSSLTFYRVPSWEVRVRSLHNLSCLCGSSNAYGCPLLNDYGSS